ncbi:MAG: hypothetical protein H6Q55_467 [Deltaproteobacteria bacterium]|nr:hypothetical protein [Deltaproteobacteria bacterium]
MATVSFQGKSGIQLPVVHQVPALYVRLGIDPSDSKHKKDKFVLTSASGKYNKTLTVTDDSVPGDGFLDLVFSQLRQSDKYTLEYHPGDGGGPQKLFENIPFQELLEHYSFVEEDDGLEGQESESSSEESGSAKDEETGGTEGGDATPTTLSAKPQFKDGHSPFDPEADSEEDEGGGVIRNLDW